MIKLQGDVGEGGDYSEEVRLDRPVPYREVPKSSTTETLDGLFLREKLLKVHFLEREMIHSRFEII